MKLPITTGLAKRMSDEDSDGKVGALLPYTGYMTMAKN